MLKTLSRLLTRNESKIETIYAVVSVGPDGVESLVTYHQPGHRPAPMIDTDLAHAEALIPIAQKLAAETGRHVALVEFTERRTIKIIDG